jgi:hypothetical protein
MFFKSTFISLLIAFFALADAAATTKTKKPSKAPVGKPSLKPTTAPTKSNKIITHSDNIPLPYNNFLAIAGTDGILVSDFQSIWASMNLLYIVLFSRVSQV